MNLFVPKEHKKMLRSQIINLLAHHSKFKSYLEIGIYDKARNFNLIQIPRKVGVDPNPVYKATHVMTSDEFFEKHSDKTFDCVFIDGLHLDEQVRRDIDHALAVLNPGGAIVIHDCNPPTKWHQRTPFEGGPHPWNGTVWKAWMWHRINSPNLNMYVVDSDWGVGIIQKGEQQCYKIGTKIDPYDYSILENDRIAALNLISVDEFKKRLISIAAIPQA